MDDRHADFEYPLFYGASKSAVLTQGAAPDKAFVVQTPSFAVPLLCTMQFGTQCPADSTFAFEAVADIEWTTAGNDVIRRVSVGAGVSITGVANQVKARIYDTTPGELYTPGSEFDYRVTALIVPGPRAGSANPPVLRAPEGPAIILTGNSADFTIPQNVGVNSVKVLVGNLGVAIATPDLVQVYHLLAPAVYLAKYSPIIYTGFQPIDSGARIVRVYNSSGGTQQATVIYGIDG